MEPQEHEGTHYHYKDALVIIQESGEHQPYSASIWIMGTPLAVKTADEEVVSRELEKAAAIPQAQPAIPNAA